MSIETNFAAMEQFLQQTLSANHVVRHEKPSVVEDGTFVIRFMEDKREIQSPYQMKSTKQFAIDYYEQNMNNVLKQMDMLSDALYEAKSIALPNAKPAMRVQSFTYSIPEDNVDIQCTGVLAVTEMLPFQQGTYSKIKNVYATYQNNEEE
ncbi:hypothetical protein [Longirhabdus pacifica]|uniref:hypothetical protein n=1 Tax=Longirhabdus pacifica TaxID=2305227 RepID=UPI0010091696|nr:hypothetical protein [Longirhabdus pacifica]